MISCIREAERGSFLGSRRGCTMMFCATILICYLFTCCTHLSAQALASQQQNLHSQLSSSAISGAAATPAAGSVTSPTKAQISARQAGDGVEGAQVGSTLSGAAIRLEDLKHDNVHRLMSEKDLRRTFQVDSHDQVPEYEILKLTVHEDGSHLISPISDLGELTAEKEGRIEERKAEKLAAAAATQTTSSSTTYGRPLDAQIEATNNHHHQHHDSFNLFETSSAEQELPVRRHKRSSSSSEVAANEQPKSGAHHLERRHEKSLSDTPADAKATSPAADQHQWKDKERSGKSQQSSGRAQLANDYNDHGGEGERSEDNDDNDDDEKLIVMKLSTFGKDFKLRLKRNVDFQQRIKDMKMFMAESTKDGQLRYTEIKHQQHKQEPHKRSAAAVDSSTPSGNIELSAGAQERHQQQSQHQQSNQATAKTSSFSAKDESSSTTSSSPSSTSSTSSQDGLKVGPAGKAAKQQANKPDRDHSSPSSATNVWNIGSTYHDEDNLAALLIDHDRKTGQLQVDGTIGNDFVIKPMPRATIEALDLKRQQAQEELLTRQQQQQQAAKTVPSTNPQQAAANDSTLISGRDANAARTAQSPQRGVNNGADDQGWLSTETNARQQGDNLERAIHMHDDDPHDDDEMFLDEDEAIELAQLQSSASIDPKHTSTSSQAASMASNTVQGGQPQPLAGNQDHLVEQQQPPRALSKAASERKWRKYRKLMAQTQVPKPGAIAAGAAPARLDPDEVAPASSTQRARRHAHAREQRAVQVSHHIVYRQRPSSEESSPEHQHSFMMAPSDGSVQDSEAAMERLASSFAPQRLAKRSLRGDSEMIEGAEMDLMAERLAKRSRAVAGESDAIDYAQDPLGGQFYLEPGSFTGTGRAGFGDWSLVGGRRRSMAPPPYALNGNETNADAYYRYEGAQSGRNNSAASGESERMPNGVADEEEHEEQEEARTRNGTVHARYRRAAPRRPASGMLKPAGSQVRRKRQAPDTVWPEVLLVVDYDSFLLHGGDSRDVKRYFVSFWNGVDLRYKLLVHPHIRISLAGMIVAKDRDATPYLERNRLRAPNADAVDAAGALTDMGKYLYREDRLPTYDLAVVITKLDMCRRRYEGGRCNRGTAGFAYVGGACVVNKRLEKVNSVAIIEDSGGFSGIIVAAHEVGHLLGCVHDGSPPPSYLGGPGATHCPWEDGFIMSDLRHTERGFRWSQCSVEQFKHFLNGETATCLYNYPHESQMLHRLLPGTMLSLDEQCKRDRGTNACFKDARVCAQLFCFDSASGYCVSYRPAAEGSPCGEGQVCRNGKCVGEIENIIPDYTHQSQTVVARRGPPHSSVVRLADNGLSASSTSTATSSPDAKPALGSGAAQLSSRMDTFPIDTPLKSLPTYGAGANYGGHYDASTGHNGPLMMRQAASSSTVSASLANARRLQPTDSNPNGEASLDLSYNRPQRSGYQAISRAPGANQSGGGSGGKGQQLYENGSQSSNSNYRQHANTVNQGQNTLAMYTSASTTISQHQQQTPSIVSGRTSNNLLTSASAANPRTRRQQQQLQPHHDNQRGR